MVKYSRFKQILIAFDQLLNAIFKGWADETISSRAYREGKTKTKWRVLKKIIDFAFFFDWNHCYKSYLSEKERLQMPPELRDIQNENKHSFD